MDQNDRTCKQLSAHHGFWATLFFQGSHISWTTSISNNFWILKILTSQVEGSQEIHRCVYAHMYVWLESRACLYGFAVVHHTDISTVLCWKRHSCTYLYRFHNECLYSCTVRTSNNQREHSHTLSFPHHWFFEEHVLEAGLNKESLTKKFRSQRNKTCMRHFSRADRTQTAGMHPKFGVFWMRDRLVFICGNENENALTVSTRDLKPNRVLQLHFWAQAGGEESKFLCACMAAWRNAENVAIARGKTALGDCVWQGWQP